MDMYKCVSDHTEDLTGGRTLAPGDYAEVDDTDEHNAARIEAGALIKVPKDVDVPKEPEPEGPAEATTEPGATDESVDNPKTSAISQMSRPSTDAPITKSEES